MTFKIFYSFVIFVFSQLSLAQTGLELTPSEKRPPIRPNISRCQTYFSPFEPLSSPTVNTTVGIPIGGGSLEEFKNGLEKLINSLGGVESVKKGHFHVTGLNMPPLFGLSKMKESYFKILEENGIDREEIELKLLTYPQEKFSDSFFQAHRVALRKLRYWAPSVERDWERPLNSEIAAGLGTTFTIELVPALYWLTVLPSPDAELMIAAHAAILVMYDLTTKSMVNWLIRDKMTRFGQFAQQASLSMPFIVNYNVFGNFTPIKNYIIENGVAESFQQFLTSELPNFLMANSSTVALQMYFYRTVMSDWLGTWMATQEGSGRSKAARIFSQYIKIFPLMIDAWLLGIAPKNEQTLQFFDLFEVNNRLIELGPAVFNLGHLGLLSFAIFGSVMAKNPKFSQKILDPLLDQYIKLTKSPAFVRYDAFVKNVSLQFGATRKKLKQRPFQKPNSTPKDK